MIIRRVVHYSTLVLSGKPHRGWWNTKQSAKNEKDLEMDVYKRKTLHRIDRLICSNLILYYFSIYTSVVLLLLDIKGHLMYIIALVSLIYMYSIDSSEIGHSAEGCCLC